jgi:hypothetical protein
MSAIIECRARSRHATGGWSSTHVAAAAGRDIDVEFHIDLRQ